MTPHRTEDQVYAEVKGLNISYRAGKGELPILKDVSIVVRPGEALALVGESGSGKSTLAGALLGHLRTGSHVVSGSVTVDGLEVFNATAKQIRALRLHSAAFVPQNAGHALTPTMRIGRQVTEVLQYGEGLGDRDARDRAAELFAQVRLPQPEQLLRRYPHELSGGQQQRVAIAMALASRPDLLILDEPTTGLDVVNQAGILALVRKLREELNPAVVLVSHDLGVVASICDTVAVTYAGRVIEWGDVRQVFDRPSHPYTAGLLSTVPTLERPGLPAAMAGQPPVASEDRPGCSFADRCDLVADVCRTGNHPPLVAVTALASEEEPRWSACLRVAQLLSTAGTEGQVWERPAHDPGPRILTVRDLEIDYRKKPDPDSGPTVAGIDLDVHAGEVVALVGESGSGKSTIAWAVAGLRRPSGGEIRLADDDATAEGLDLTVSAARRSPSVRRRIQLIFQNADTSLNPRRTVGDAVTRPIKVFGLADDHGALVARRDQAFDDVGLPAQFAGRIPGQLSGGQRQRIGIARAVAAGPTLVLADEVVSALDVSVQASVLRLMEDLRGEYRLGYLFISHDLAVVRGLADRVIVLYLGRICEEGPVDEVYSLRANHPYTSLLMASVLGPHGAGGPAVSEQQSEPASAPPPEGCPFFHRCSERIEGTCEVGVPPWREVSSRHRIRCHLSLETLGHREGSH